MTTERINKLSEEDKDVLMKASCLMKFGFNIEDIKSDTVFLSIIICPFPFKKLFYPSVGYFSP